MKQWKDLSNEAKNIIEWVENPFTNKKMILTVNRNEDYTIVDKKIQITDSLFNEIKKYIAHGKDIKVIESDKDKLIFTLEDKIPIYVNNVLTEVTTRVQEEGRYKSMILK